MRLRELKAGTQINNDTTIRSLLESHRGIARYLATRAGNVHTLVHVLPSFEEQSIHALELAVRVDNELQRAGAECGAYQEFLYFAEDFPLGEYLFEWLERRERVSTTEALRRIVEMLKVLTRAHEQGVFHGRISPKSVLIERSGSAFSLRLMGLGVAQAMTASMQWDLDWFEYSFDLEGMSPQAVDIYGVAIILMGMVSGESGIDSFEATGLLPQAMRGGVLQMTMERALALNDQSYETAFAFMQDLEASLLELDERQGEVFVGDLVGFQSVVRNVVGTEPKERSSDYSGLWNAIVNDLDKEERNSILYSLTSLSAIKSGESAVQEEDDDDETKITSAPSGIFGVRRIHNNRAEEASGVTQVIERPKVEAVKPVHPALDPIKPSTAERIAELSALEPHELEEESPTRIMKRPNYQSISLTSQDSDGVISAVNAAISEANKEQTFMKRILGAQIDIIELQIGHVFNYDLNDPVAFPPQTEESTPEQMYARESLKALVGPKNNALGTPPIPARIMQGAQPKDLSRPQSAPVRKKVSKKQLLIVLVILLVVIIALIVVKLLTS